MIKKRWTIWIGHDPRETAAYAVTRESAKANMSFKGIPIKGVILDDLRRRGLYKRPTTMRLGKLWDDISGAYMSTEFAISRFFVPMLAGSGWAIFMDCDMIVRGNIARLFDNLDDRYALYCVKHNYLPASGDKMDGQEQTVYPRKNWSSFMAFNCDHPANRRLTLDMLNTWPGRDLHAFKWLEDRDIGELDRSWNWLVGEQAEPDGGAKVVHYTLGGPWFSAFHNAPYAAEWRDYYEKWAA